MPPFMWGVLRLPGSLVSRASEPPARHTHARTLSSRLLLAVALSAVTLVCEMSAAATAATAAAVAPVGVGGAIDDRFAPLVAVYGEETFRQIQAAKVLVVGAGGIGQKEHEHRGGWTSRWMNVPPEWSARWF